MTKSEQLLELNKLKIDELRAALDKPEYAEAAELIRACISCLESGMTVDDLIFIMEYANRQQNKGDYMDFCKAYARRKMQMTV